MYVSGYGLSGVFVLMNMRACAGGGGDGGDDGGGGVIHLLHMPMATRVGISVSCP